MELIDTHAHLPMLKHDTSAAILERAKAAGVGRMVTVSTDESNWDANRDFAHAHPHLTYSVGLHPHDASRWRDVKAGLDKFFPDGQADPKCVAIGELGLDFHYSMSAHDLQLEALEDQIRLAQKVNLPIIIHCRNAFRELFDTLRRLGLPKRGGVMHCFTGASPDAREAVDLGLHISFSGIVTFKNAQDIRDAAKILPHDRIVVETDCPFLAPIPMRGKPNEPSYLPHTAQLLGDTIGIPLAKVAEITTRNAVELFGL